MTLLFFSFITILAVGFTLRYIRADGWMDGVPLLFSGSCHGSSHSWASMVLYGVVVSCLVLFSLAVWVGLEDRLAGFLVFDLGYLCCRSCCSVSFNSSS